MKQLPLDIAPRPQATFENYCPGPNEAAWSHLRRVLDGDPPTPVPIYLWGEEGSGKTHLLQAAAATLAARGRAFGWLDATSPFASFDESWAAIFLDDVERFDGERQQWAFNWFVHALAPADGQARLVLAAGRLPPTDLRLRDDLRSRLAWGHVFEIKPLSDAQRRAVLLQSARERGLELREEVVDYILVRFPRDLGSLNGLVEQLDRYALSTQRSITIPLIRAMMEDA